MPGNIIDIHPHIISSDTKRYPLAPLGGKQSGWSRDRPVTFEQYIAAMDEAGVAKAAIVHASTSYGYDNSTSPIPSPRNPRVSPVFSVDVLASDAAGASATGSEENSPGCGFTTGSTMPSQAPWLEDPLAAGVGSRRLGIPICVQMTPAAIPQLAIAHALSENPGRHRSPHEAAD